MKKLLSLLLVCTFLVCLCSPVFAADTCSCGFSPIIYVGPLGCTSIVRDAGTDSAQQLWKTDTKYLLACAKDIAPTLGKAALTMDTDTLGDALIDFTARAFGDLALEDGASKKNVTTPELNVPEGSKHGIDSDYYFDYDFRLDPMQHAERLHAFIEEVKRLTGHDSVKLKCSSMGGVVLAAYLEKYGYDGIDAIICRCCPLWGTAVAGELFCGKLELNATAIRRYAEDAIPFMDAEAGEDFLEGSLIALVGALRSAGTFRLLAGLGDRLIEKLGDRIYSEALIPIFGSMPGIWAFVPQEYYADALQYMHISESSNLYKQISAYRVAQSHVAQNLQNARANGVVVCITCGYNVQRTPLVSLWKSTSDGTVDTKYASMGAVCGDTKEALPDAYLVSMTDTTYLSPDHQIDASACALRDCTWFFKDWLHCNGNPAVDKFYNLVFTSKQVSITAFKEYPQFMQIDDDAETLTPVTGEADAAARFRTSPTYLNFVRMVLDFFDKIINHVTAWFAHSEG